MIYHTQESFNQEFKIESFFKEERTVRLLFFLYYKEMRNQATTKKQIENDSYLFCCDYSY